MPGLGDMLAEVDFLDFGHRHCELFLFLCYPIKIKTLWFREILYLMDDCLYVGNGRET